LKWLPEEFHSGAPVPSAGLVNRVKVLGCRWAAPDRHVRPTVEHGSRNDLLTRSVSKPVSGQMMVVVLAGGKSRRFAGDKLRAPLGGRTVLARVVMRVSPLSSIVIVATRSESRDAELLPQLPPTIQLLHDRPAHWGNGPGAAMASARETLTGGAILFVPGDIPWAETEALERFVAASSQSDADVAVPFWGGGETEHLIQWQRNPSILSYLPWKSPARPPSSWRASEFLRAAPRTLLVPVAALTDRPEVFSHVTFPSDLEHPAPRGQVGRRKLPWIVDGFPKRCYREGHAARLEGDLALAARLFAEESRWYENAGLSLFALHALDDARSAAIREPAAQRAIGPEIYRPMS
jgi:molybdopterin-guanine dinucleotide biosynthesis protein A